MLLVAGVGTVNAGKLYADLSKLGNGPVSTWDGVTNTMTWTGTSNNMISNFDFAAGDYSAYSTISITVSNLTNAVGVRLQIRANGQEKIVALNGNGSFTKNLIDDFGFTAADLANVEWIRVLGSAWQNGESHTIDAENPASAVISDVYLFQPTRTRDVVLSKLPAISENTTWDVSTGTFAWSGTSWNSTELFGSGNYSSFTTLNLVTAAGTADHFRIIMKFTNGAGQVTINPVATGTVSLTLTDYTTTENLANIETIRLSGANDGTGNITISRIYLEGPVVNYIKDATVKELPVGVTDINGITGTGDAWSITYPQTVSDGTQFGGDIDRDTKSAAISTYDYLLFVVSDASADAKINLRTFVSTAQSSDNSTRVILYPRPIADYKSIDDDDWTTETTITEPGIYVVKIAGYPFLRGIKNRAYWQEDAGSIKISMAYVGSGSPVAPIENIVRTGEEALTDPYATCFDVTKLEGSGITFNATNPNALFIAKAGELTNTNNVIINRTCANLVLTDNYPFQAPSNFTATAASYSTTINTTAQCGTLCLPFDATIPGGVTAYTLSYLNGNDAATLTPVETTIPANTPVLLNGSGAATFTGSGAVVADATNVSGALTGVFANTVVPLNSYVLQNGASGIGFYKVASDITAKPFRAYLTGQVAGSKEFLSFNFDKPTAISQVQGSGFKVQDSEIFNVAGQRLSKLQKGLNIVNGKKVMVK